MDTCLLVIRKEILNNHIYSMTSTYFAVIFVHFFLIDYKLILKSTKSRCTAKFMGTTQELLACHNNFFCLKV